MERAKKAAALFEQGYNCAQAVAVAFCDLTGQTPEQAAQMASCFGGGMGRMREVCGAVSGMLLVLGLLEGYHAPEDNAGKKALYEKVQQLAAGFRTQNGSIVCRELLGNPPADPSPTPRSAEFYQMRPCTGMVYTAAELLEAHLAGNDKL